jgi:hypothetical protein
MNPTEYSIGYPLGLLWVGFGLAYGCSGYGLVWLGKFLENYAPQKLI